MDEFYNDEEMQELPEEYKDLLEPPSLDVLLPKFQLWTAYPVAVYSKKYQSSIPNSVINLLDKMSPDGFMKWLCEVLKPDQRNQLMLSERRRRKTFFAKGWMHRNPISSLSAERMARAGLFYLNVADQVHCPFCGECICDWTEDDDPLAEHQKFSYRCPFLQGEDCGNQSYEDEAFFSKRLLAEKNMMLESIDILPPHSHDLVKTSHEFLGVLTYRAFDVSKAKKDVRIATFKNWPAETVVKPDSLAEAGFFYSENEDEVTCFFCGCRLKNWKSGDNAWTEHARWFPYCEFLKVNKGEEFIEDMHKAAPTADKGDYVDVKEPSDVQEIINLCLKAGHSQSTVDKAIEYNGGPFHSIKKMVNAIYKIEEHELDLQYNQPVRREKENYSSQPPKEKGMCRICEEKDVMELATTLALPCGHLVFCERCRVAVKQTANEEPNSPIRCPYYLCNQPIWGCAKTYTTAS